MKSLVSIIFLISIISFANADEGKTKFINGITQRYTSLLCDAEYLDCINKKRSECVSSVIDSVASCSIDNFYKATNPDGDDMKLILKQLEKEGNLFGGCFFDAFMKNIKISEEKLESCGELLP